MRKSGPRSLSPSLGTNLALALRVRVLTAPVKPAPFSFWVKVPMVAIVAFLFLSGRTMGVVPAQPKARPVGQRPKPFGEKS